MTAIVKENLLLYKGSSFLRQKLVLSVISGKPVRILNIRTSENEPGLKEYEISLIRLLDKVTNGTVIEVNETGTSLYFQPGLLYGGVIEHDCSVQRGIGYYLETLFMLGFFCKQSLVATLRGVTNIATDPSVDLMKTSMLQLLKKFILDEGLELKICKRGMLPLGGGEVVFKCPVRKQTRPVQLLDAGMIKRIRGTSYALRVSPALANRMVDSAKGILIKFIPDVYINTDQCKGKQSGKSPGFGIHLLAETTNGVVYSAEQASAPETLKRLVAKVNKGRSRQKYSPELRSFALTLSFYSTDAYNYVRNTFNLALPHVKTLAKWYRSVEGTPGFTNESLAAIKVKVEEAKKEIFCNLIFDEMSIMQRVEWNGKRFTGYVDLGTEVYGDSVAEAKEALVFMVVPINGHWKIPVGYFLTDGLNGMEKANLLKKCLNFLNETGIKIVSVTFDGAPSNINMCKILGANIENPVNLKTYFLHPATNEKVYIILDICHMLKLIRNCLGTYGALQDPDNREISWNYFTNLVAVQQSEGLKAATKLKKRHLQWYREKMKVCLAAQTFSNSVADALLYLQYDLKHPEFSNAAATAEFVKTINNLFDIFNSQNRYSKALYKRSISTENAIQIFSYLENCRNYIFNLKLAGQPVLSCKRKIGFLGFLVSIRTLKALYEEYVTSGKLQFISTYKLSQDHLELFFSAVRRKGGSCNNPTARQFENIYKRLLVHAEIKGSANANTIALDNTSILHVSSITKTASGDNLEENTEYKKFSELVLDMDFLNSTAWHLIPYVVDVVGYIAGFVVKCLKKCVTCSQCLSVLETTHSLSLLQVRKRYGKLINASKFVIDICSSAESCLRVFNISFNLCGTKNVKAILVSKILHNLPIAIYDYFGDHLFDGDPLNTHFIQLTKLILNKYLEIRIHHEAAKLKDC